ncbi:unnamed protein product [Pleuronectes platessa]|uniref:MIF4G domain-containing protein n=1 Tax=Pleuronectes platessa TaxID=8262 RepID=A0A9N7VXC0_PLEPL|nr:unnamed protein product [Pleuronectes platessa]
MFRRPRDREAVGSLEASASSKKPWTPPDRRGEKWHRVPSKPVGFLHAASYEHRPQVDIAFGFPSIQRTENTEEEAVRKEQVRPEETVSCVTDNFQAFISHEEMDGEESLQETVELVFKRAVQKPDSAAVFANLCQRLSTVEFQSLSDWSASVSFRSLLVKHCQAEVIDRLREEKNNAKPSCRSIHTIRFIGELFLSKVLGEKAMHCCFRRLLQNGDGPSLESLCELLQLIQQDLEVVTSREVMDSYYNQLKFVAEKGRRAPRLSLLLKDTVKARK